MATHSPSPTLVNLPQEILATILSECLVKDVLILRQCCKTTELASRGRSLWLNFLKSFSRDWDISFDQFYPHDRTGTSSRDLELAVTAQYRLYRIMGTGSPEDLPRLSPKLAYKFTAASAWRAAKHVPGGRWIAAISGQVLRVYHVGILSSTRGLPIHAVVCEQECSFLPKTKLQMEWGCCFDSKSYLIVQEYGEGLGSELLHWVFTTQVETTGDTLSLRLNLLGVIKTPDSTAIWMNEPSFPVFLTDEESNENFMWSLDGGRVPVSPLEIHPSEVIYRPAYGGCACWFNDTQGLEVWKISPQPFNEGSTITLQELRSFDCIPNVETDTEDTYDIEIAVGSSSCSPEGYALRFGVLKRELDLGKSTVEFSHKGLFLETEHDRLVGCRLEDLGSQTLTSFPSHVIPLQQDSTLDVCVNGKEMLAGKLSASLDGQIDKAISIIRENPVSCFVSNRSQLCKNNLVPKAVNPSKLWDVASPPGWGFRATLRFF
ncbi:hypothetical protein DL96DRAFT_1675833 [Flagelloscypha sp. PMI_526]|nr:hypothetical protein DL96DRAFT_1675833 [Flagelloscypha sp. PMI_526]